MTSTVILGSGIIGLATAYYLADHQPGSTIHLVDASPHLFASASGFAGGFVSKDWFQPSCAALGALSFEEHRRLAEEFDGARKWGYSPSVTVSYDPTGGKPRGSQGEDWLSKGGSRAEVAKEREEAVQRGEVPAWLKRVDGDEVKVLDSGDGAAIVDPLRLCYFLLDRCKELGVHVHHPATALFITKDVRDELASIRIGYTNSSNETELPCTRLLLAAGAWTPRVFSSLFPESSLQIPVSSLAGHSLAVKIPRSREPDGNAQVEERCHSVYCDLEDLAPEVYSRRGGIIYLAGVNSSDIRLPDLATSAMPHGSSISRLRDIANRLIATPEGKSLVVIREGLCFRPVTPRGTPIIARIADEHFGRRLTTRPGSDGGVFVATGHGPWGISLSLGTGKVMAEMMQGRTMSADVSQLGL